MLDKEAYGNIETIKMVVQDAWSENCVLGEIEEIDSPYPEFEWPIRLYGQFDVKLIYDRSTLSIGVPTKDGHVVLSMVAKEPIFIGFDGMKPEKMVHNFKVLDKLLKDQMA